MIDVGPLTSPSHVVNPYLCLDCSVGFWSMPTCSRRKAGPRGRCLCFACEGRVSRTTCLKSGSNRQQRCSHALGSSPGNGPHPGRDTFGLQCHVSLSVLAQKHILGQKPQKLLSSSLCRQGLVECVARGRPRQSRCSCSETARTVL